MAGSTKMLDGYSSDADKQSSTNLFDSNSAISEVASSSILILSGMILGMALEYITKIVVARSLGVSGYGQISLGRAILAMTTALSVLGFPTGVSRYIGFYSAKNDLSSVKGTVISGLKLIIPVSSICTILLFFLRRYIATTIFKKQEIELVITIFAFALPFSALGEFFYASLRGLKKFNYAVLSREIIFRFSTIALVIIFLSVRPGLYGVTLAYCFGFAIFGLTAFFLNLGVFKKSIVSVNVTKELLRFSWPLIFSFILMQFETRVDTILIGYFRTSKEVGFYNAAMPIARLILIFLDGFLFIFLPVASGLYARGKYEELKFIYQGVTRWIFLFSAIGFLLLVIFPKTLLLIMFGEQYIPAAISLSILAFAFFVNSIFGPVGSLLLTIGKTKEYFLGDILGVSGNIFLNILLIPRFGIEGAAYAVLSSMVIVNLIRSIFIYRYLKTQPFNLSYLKFFVPAVIWSYLIYLLFNSYIAARPILIILAAVMLAILSLLSTICLKGVEKQDLEIFSILERKFGIKFPILRKFITFGISAKL